MQHPLDLVDEAHDAGWDVLVDAAAFAPTNRFDVGPLATGLRDALLLQDVRLPHGRRLPAGATRPAGPLCRPWFAGGTITIASVQGDGHYLHDDEAAFEDGTVDYLNLPAVDDRPAPPRAHRPRRHPRPGRLPHGVAARARSSGCATPTAARWCRSTGPPTPSARGGTVTFLMHDVDGRPIDDRRVEELANRVSISLRTGCFCNPGAGEIAHHLGAGEMQRWFERDEPVSFLELRERLLAEHDLLVAAIRVSVGARDQLRRRLPVPVLHAGLRRPHRRRDRPGRVRLRQLPHRARLRLHRRGSSRRTSR